MQPGEQAIILALVGAALLFLRWMSLTALQSPPQDPGTGAGPASGEEDLPGDDPESLEGSLGGDGYLMEADEPAAWRVTLDEAEGLARPLTVELRGGRGELPGDARGAEVKALAELGAVLVEVDPDLDEVAAVLPRRPYSRADPALARKVAARLIRLRDLSR